MSKELIETLRAAAAFDATPLPEDLAALHVPFDDLLGEAKTENELQKAAEAGGRIALVGAMGAGKSSVLAYALTPSAGFAPSLSRLPRRATRPSPTRVASPSTWCG